MVPKENGFNQSDTASCCCAHTFWPAMARDGEVIQRQHFYHLGDTICLPKSGYVTTKRHGTSICGCNNNAMFSGRAIFHVSYRRFMLAMLISSVHAKLQIWQPC